MSNSNDPSQLAIDGGKPAVTAGPFEWPLPDEQVRTALEAVLQDGDWGRYHGQRCEQLRLALAAMHGREHVQLTCSGTMAVELALRGVGVQPGDEVLLAAYDFPGNFRAIEAIGARPVLVDIEADSWVIGAEQFSAAMANGPSGGAAAKAIVVSHLHGTLAPMAQLVPVARERGIAVVEDACQAPGATVEGQIAGSWGDASVLSFGGSKLLTAGRGGALLTSDDTIAQRARVFAARGNDAFPLSELQAAVLLPQLEGLDERNRLRRQQASKLLDAVAGTPGLELPATGRLNSTPAYYKVALRTQRERLRSTRESIIAALQAEGAPIDVGFRGFAKRSSRRCRKATSTPHAEMAAEETITLHHPALLAPPHAIDQIAMAVSKVLSHYSAD